MFIVTDYAALTDCRFWDMSVDGMVSLCFSGLGNFVWFDELGGYVFQCTKWSMRFNKLDVFQLTKEHVCFNRLADLKWHQIGCVWMDVSMVW